MNGIFSVKGVKERDGREKRTLLGLLDPEVDGRTSLRNVRNYFPVDIA
jgi:hypothetical protein